MKLEINPGYVKSESRRQVWVSLFLLLLIAVGVAKAARSDGLSDYIIPVFCVLVVSKLLFGTVKRIKTGAAAYPDIFTSDDNKVLNVQYMDTVLSVTLSDIKKATLQYRKDRLAAILLKTKSDVDIRIAGYRNMDRLGEILKSTMNPENIKTATWFHL